MANRLEDGTVYVLHAIHQGSHGSVDQRGPVSFPVGKALAPVLHRREKHGRPQPHRLELTF